MKTGHVIQRCEHGTVALQCRCIGEHEIQIVPCPASCPQAKPAKPEPEHSLDRAVFAQFMGKAH